MLDLVVRGGRVVAGRAVLDGYDVGVADGRIAAIAAAGTLPEARATFDAAGRYVLPGLIDPHTHPGNWRAFEDDIRATSRSAAAGGIATIFATVKSPRLAPPFKEITEPADVVSYLKVFDQARAAIERSSLGDVGLSFGISTDEQASEIARYVSELGVRSFKFHPAAAPSAWRARVGQPLVADDGSIYLALEGVARAGALAMVHAENGQLARAVRPSIEARGRHDLAAWNESSPDTGEASEIHRLAFFCRDLGCRLYVAHVTSRAGLDAIREERALGARIVAETCPQYLLHSVEEGGEDVRFKYNPPVRTAADREALWQAVASGDIECVGSDHVPNASAAKRGRDFWSAIGGSAGTETMLPVLMHEGVHRRGLDIVRVAELMSAGPARAFDVHPAKGVIAVGSDADLTVVDPDLERTVRIAELVSRAETDWSPLEGRTLRGWPVATFRRGELIAEDGRVAEAGPGRYLARRATA